MSTNKEMVIENNDLKGIWGRIKPYWNATGAVAYLWTSIIELWHRKAMCSKDLLKKQSQKSDTLLP